ncbi:uncharacterized protein LOC116193268 isoform X4 [Punica granatum]|uniref:Uncharacterized protein LOC116193268 isoform X4 n=1 Tax=Punica granatum TaxID=22663 RepID=A0A6P8C877_PUNGR|nr:uncharacterized protein LOC116193268 isoform X4 [Punica granatum]
MSMRFSALPWRSFPRTVASEKKIPLSGKAGTYGLSALSPSLSALSVPPKPLLRCRASFSTLHDAAPPGEISLPGVEDEMVGYIFGKKKATDVAHSWKELVKLFPTCHSKMEEVIPKDVLVRLVAFNLGYLPGGDKEISTVSETTLLALEAAGRIIEPGGLISAVVYVGHPKGREEFEAVQAFASGLSTEDWVCCKLQMLNRPLAPVPIFMFKR